MNMKAMLGAVLALALAVGGTAFLASRGATGVTPPAPVIASDDPEMNNPFDLIAPGPKPKVVVPETQFAFGLMALGDEQSHDYVFTNEGKGPLRLAKGLVQCKCTIPEVTDKEIQPGESVNIKLTWKPVESTQDFRKEAIIWTNDPETPKIILSIGGKVFDDPGFYPGQFALGDIPWNKENESEVILASVTSADLRIDELEVSHPEWMIANWEKADISELMEKGANNPNPLSGFKIKLKISPSATVGPFAGWIKVKVNRNNGEKKIDVVGTRTGPISIFGTDFQSALSLLDLNRIKSEEGREMRLNVFLEPFGQDFQILEVESTSKHLTASLSKQPAPSPKKDRYFLNIKVDPGMTPGTIYTIENPDKLRIKTNHPLVPELLFNARYIVH